MIDFIGKGAPSDDDMPEESEDSMADESAPKGDPDQLIASIESQLAQLRALVGAQ